MSTPRWTPPSFAMALVATLIVPLVSPMVPAAAEPAAVRTQVIEYRYSGEMFEGYLAYDAMKEGKRPGVLVIHEWWGLNDYARQRARQLAEMGYVAFALDMFGAGRTAGSAEEAAKLAGALYGDRGLMRERALSGLKVLMQQSQVDTSRIAVIGFCFGGTTAIELAMSGADVAGVVSFHGGLEFPDTADVKNIKASVLVCHGGEDPYVPEAELMGFCALLKAAGVDYEINVYGGAVHSFTNPAAGNDKSRGAAYNERAADRAWRDMQEFFAEIF